MKAAAAVLYLVSTCLVYFFANYPNLTARWADVSYPRELGYLAATVYGVGRVGLVLGWISLLPAWWMAVRCDHYWLRSGLYFAGLVVFFFPYFSSPLGEEEQYAFWHTVALAVALSSSILLALVYKPKPSE